MKRSEINAALKELEAMVKEYKFALDTESVVMVEG